MDVIANAGLEAAYSYLRNGQIERIKLMVDDAVYGGEDVFLKVGDEVQLSFVTSAIRGGEEITTGLHLDNYYYESLDPAVAQVDENGLIVAKSSGITTVRLIVVSNNVVEVKEVSLLVGEVAADVYLKDIEGDITISTAAAGMQLTAVVISSLGFERIPEEVAFGVADTAIAAVTAEASSVFIIRGISGWKLREGVLLLLGVILGVTICTLSPTQTPDGLWFIFLSGAIAICAMVLPGISGSFILLILGKYQYMMGVISDLVSGVDFGRNLLILGVFAIGAIVGILGFSKLLHWLLARWNKETLIVLAGFIIGSLVKVWPWSNPEALAQAEETGSMLYGSAALFALIGLTLVTSIELIGKSIARNK